MTTTKGRYIPSPKLLVGLAAAAVVLLVTVLLVLSQSGNKALPGSSTPAANAAPLPIPNQVKIQCTTAQQCPVPAVSGNNLGGTFQAQLGPLTVVGLTNADFTTLCEAGYQYRWLDNYGYAHDLEGGTYTVNGAVQTADASGPPELSCPGAGANPDAHLQSEGFTAYKPGPWTISWKLIDPEDQVVLMADFFVEVPSRT